MLIAAIKGRCERRGGEERKRERGMKEEGKNEEETEK